MVSQQPVAGAATSNAALYRATNRFILLGVFAAAVSTLFIAIAIAPPAWQMGFWAYVAAIQAVLVATVTLYVAEARIRPSEADFTERWLPLANIIGWAFNLLVIASPWVILPLASPALAVVIYLIYAWFLMLTLLGSVARNSRTIIWLVTLPISLATCLIMHDLAMALPIGGFFVLMGISLSIYERSRHPLEQALRPAPLVAPLSASIVAAPQPAPPPLPPAPPLPPSGGLTPRQDEVLRHVSRGLTNKEIARELGISPATVKVHLAQIMAATGAANRAAAAVLLHVSSESDTGRQEAR